MANWIDRLVSYVSPQSGASRARARLVEKTYRDLTKTRRYEGASTGRRTDGWFTTGASASAEIGPALSRLRNRSRDLVRNNPWAARGIQVIVSNTVGTGIIPQIKGKNEGQVKRLTDQWQQWGETPACDADGKFDFYGLQALITRTIVESGGVILRRRRRRLSDGLPVPLQIQVLEPDFIDLLKEGEFENGNYIVQGIEFNKLGKVVAFWLFDQHPGDAARSLRKSSASRRIDAEDVRYVFRGGRPGQVHDVPWISPAIIKLRDFDEFEDAQLVRQKISACFTAFVVDSEAPTDPAEAQDDFGDRLEPGAIEKLPPGKDIRFPSPPGVTGYGEYAAVILRSVAMALGITYEQLTGDYSQGNFSFSRMGWLEFNRNVGQWQWTMMIPSVCVPVMAWFFEAAELAGYGSTGAHAVWTPPRREMIDPKSDVAAIRDAMRTGIKTPQEAIREQGYDPEDFAKEYSEGLKLFDKYGLVFDSDPRRIAGNGGAQPSTQGGQDAA